MVSVDQLSPEFLMQLQLQQENKALGQWVDEQFRKMKTMREPVEKQWYLNLAFYFGNQYVQPMRVKTLSGAQAFNIPKAPPWRVRLVVNRVRPIIRTEIAKLTAQRPSVYVVPATGEEQDKAAARAAEQIWNAAYRDHEVAKVLRRTLWWGVICGNSFLKEYWDTSIGPVQSIQPPSKSAAPLEIPQGDVKMEIVTPFHILVPDLMCEEIEDQPYVLHSTVKSVDYVKRVYGITVNPSASAPDTLIDPQFMNIIGDANVNKKDSVLCHEMWIKPGGHTKFPQGGLLTIIDSQVVQRIDKYPYPHKRYPFAKFDHVQTGKFYSDSVVTDLIPLQRELNRTRSQIIEAKNLMSKPQLLAPKGSVDPRKITSEPGQVIQYTPGMQPPTPLPVQPLPSYVLQEVDRLVQDMDDVSGQHEISRGQNPSQVTAYSALSYLQEQDESKLAASVASVEEFIEKVARLYLKYVVYYWDLPRTVRVVGKDKIVDAASWKGSDIEGNTDIRVEAGSAIPLGKQQKQSFLLDLYKMGAIDPSMLFELLEMNDLSDANQDFLVDKQQVMRENVLMMQMGEKLPPEALQPSIDPMTGQQLGPQVPQMFSPNSFDNHEAHVHYHNMYRKSQEFATAPEVVKQLFEMHVNLHQQALMGGVAPTAGSVDGQPGEPIGGQQQQQIDPATGQPAEPAPAGGNTSTPSNTQPPQQGN
jgi:hypothetical protein